MQQRDENSFSGVDLAWVVPGGKELKSSHGICVKYFTILQGQVFGQEQVSGRMHAVTL